MVLVGGMLSDKVDHSVGVGFLEKFYGICRATRRFFAVRNHYVRTFHHIFISVLHAALVVMVGQSHRFVRFFQNFDVPFLIGFGKVFFLSVTGNAGDQLYLRIFFCKTEDAFRRDKVKTDCHTVIKSVGAL